MEKLIIDRTKWLRGDGNGVLQAGPNNPFFQAVIGKRCCLGFECLRLGLSELDIEDAVMPRHLAADFREKLPAWLTIGPESGVEVFNGTDVNELSRINDLISITDAVREKQIQEIFAKHDVEVEFIN